MQIGWCSANCKFNQDEMGVGVGDTENSYGYDGSRLTAWHIESQVYGTKFWRTGDIITICLDMDDGVIKYYRNGINLGDAFRSIPTGEDYTLYPAVSLAFNESLSANFGGSPFRYPVTNYAPLQDANLDTIYKCECLLIYLVDLSHFISKSMNRNKDIKMANGIIIKTDAILLVFGSMIIDRLAGLLKDKYLIQSCVYPYIKRLCVMRCGQGKNPIQPGTDESTLGNLLSLLWNHMHYDDIVAFIGSLIGYMESIYSETSSNTDFEKQRSTIVVLSCLCNHQRTRKYLLTEIFFKDNW